MNEAPKVAYDNLCSKGHPMDSINDNPYKHMGAGVRVSCDACGNQIQVPGEEFLHCAQGCNEDYCSKCKHKAKQEVLTEIDIKAKIPDGRYKAKWLSSGKVSDEFKVIGGKYVLFKKDYHLKCINDEVKFDWGEGTVQQLEETLTNGDITWKVLNNQNHKKIIWINQDMTD